MEVCKNSTEFGQAVCVGDGHAGVNAGKAPWRSLDSRVFWWASLLSYDHWLCECNDKLEYFPVFLRKFRLAALHHCVGWLSVDPDFTKPARLKGSHCMFSTMYTNSPVFGMYLSFLFAFTLCLPVSYHQGHRIISGQTYATKYAPKYSWCSLTLTSETLVLWNPMEARPDLASEEKEFLFPSHIHCCKR